MKYIAIPIILVISYYFYNSSNEYEKEKLNCETQKEIYHSERFIWLISGKYIDGECFEIYNF